MTRNELRQAVDLIIADGDDEAQHLMEDGLHLDVIFAFCPEWVQAEIDRLSAADFHRWTA